MKKITKIRGFVAALIFTFSFSTIASAQPVPKIEQKNSKNEGMLNEKQKDKTTRELEKINSKLDKIEKDIKYTSQKINKYFSTSLEDQETEDVTDENQDVTNEEVENVTDENQDATNEEVEDVTDENQDATNEEIEDVTDENQDATNEEESISGYSFIGKLNALNNRIEAIKKQLNSPSGKLDKTSPEYAEIVDRISKLKKDISVNVEKLKAFESPVLEKLKNKIEEQKEYTPKNKLVETNKTWTIKFNKNLKLESFKGTNIFVVDSDNTLVETKVTFDQEAGSIKITPVENYLKGKKYTLFISKDVKSDNGSVLSQATRVPFEVK